MPSPFPGMNPYLESPDDFSSVHRLMIDEVERALSAAAPARYIIRGEVTRYIEMPPADERRMKPGVMVVTPRQPSTVATVDRTFQHYVELDEADEREQWSVRVHDSRDNRLVTAIEFLSPTNKAGGWNRDAYVKKRESLLGRVNFVEVDLLRAHPRMHMCGLPRCDYCALVSRPHEYARAGIWPWALREPMPTVPIPLLPEDEPVLADLQAMLHRAYDAGGFARYVYATEPVPPLSGEDAAWAGGVLDAAGVRHG